MVHQSKEQVDLQSELSRLKALLEFERNEKMRFIESSYDGFWDWHVKEDYEYMSHRFWEIFGYDPKLKKHCPSEWQKLIHPDDLKVALKNFDLHVKSKGKHPYVQEARYKHKEGHWCTVLCRGKVVEWDNSGQPLRMVGTHTDITEIKKANEWLTLALEVSKVGVWDWNLDSNNLHWDEGMHRLYDIKPQDQNLPYDVLWRRSLHPDDIERVGKEVQLSVEQGVPFESSFRIIVTDNKIRYIKARAKTFFDSENRPVRLLGANWDITKDRVHQLELQKSKDEIARSNRELKGFAYIVSHDLQAPLRHITSYMEILKEALDDKLDQKTNALMKKIVNGAEKMKNLIRDLLSYSRINKENFNVETIVTQELVSNMVSMFKNKIRERNAQVTIEKLPNIVGSQTHLNMMFQNLFENALKFIPKERKPQITIGFFQTTDHQAFFVQDNGIGISEKKREEIFQVFRKLNCPSDFEGSGIGLSIVKKVADEMSAKIEVESKVNEGSKFIIYFPKNQSDS